MGLSGEDHYVIKRYAVTIKITRTDRPYFAHDYDVPIEVLRVKQSLYGVIFTLDSCVYELDSKGRVHYHGIWSLVEGDAPRFRDFNCKGCSCVIREIYHSTGWKRYMMKDQKVSESGTHPPSGGSTSPVNLDGGSTKEISEVSEDDRAPVAE